MQGYIRKREGKKGPSYQVVYRGTNGKLHSKTFTKGPGCTAPKHDAEAYLSQIGEKVRKLEWVDPKKGKTRFHKVVEEWQRRRKRGLKPLTDSTIAREDTDIKNHILPVFGDMPIGSIRWEDVEDFRDEKLRTLSPATVTRILTVLSQIMKRAVKERFIPSNPCKEVERPGDKKKRRDIFLTAAELNALADNVPPRYRALILLAGYRGLRFGELAGLKKSCLNLLNSNLEVREQLVDVNGKRSFEPPKTEEGARDFTLPPFLVEALANHIAEFSPTGEMVFTSEESTTLRDSNFNRRVWQKARATLPEGKRALKFHELRHTAVSLLAADGASIIEVGAILGWSEKTIPHMIARYADMYRTRDEKLAEATEATYRAAVTSSAAAKLLPNNVVEISSRRKPIKNSR